MSRSLRILWLAVAVWAVAALLRSAATLPDRGGRSALAGLEPFLWVRASPEVRALEVLLDRQRDALERGTTVLVLADAGPGVDASFVWHWAQYLRPGANFLWVQEAWPGLAPPWALVWGPAAPRAGWREVDREGAAVLYRVER